MVNVGEKLGVMTSGRVLTATYISLWNVCENDSSWHVMPETRCGDVSISRCEGSSRLEMMQHFVMLLYGRDNGKSDGGGRRRWARDGETRQGS